MDLTAQGRKWQFQVEKKEGERLGGSKWSDVLVTDHAIKRAISLVSTFGCAIVTAPESDQG